MTPERHAVRVPAASTRHCTWQKATASYGQSACVEFTDDLEQVGMRDSKRPEQAALASTDVRGLLRAARAGDMDVFG